MTTRIARGAVAAVAAAALAGLVGCSSKADVVGKVTYNGKTLTTGSVSLIAQDNIQYAGVIGADGKYSISNVPAGTVKILVTSINPDAGTRNTRAKGGEGDLAGGGAPAPSGGSWFPIPDKYGSPTTSDLTGEVRGGSATLNIDLK